MQHNRTSLNGATAEVVARKRHNLGLSQLQLARAAGVGRTTVARVEGGVAVEPANATKIGAALTLFELLTGGSSTAELDDRMQAVEEQARQIELELAQIVAALCDLALAAARALSLNLEGDPS